MRPPDVLPISVASSVSTGATPGYILGELVRVSTYLLSTGIQMVLKVSISWLMKYWCLTCLLVAFALQRLVACWWNRGPASPETIIPSTPVSGTDIHSVVPGKSSGGGDGGDTQLCQISQIMRHGGPNAMMRSKTCPNEASFILPLGCNGKPTPVTNNGSIMTAPHPVWCAMCTGAFGDLPTTRCGMCLCGSRARQHGKSEPNIARIGSKCNQHTKERILRGDDLPGGPEVAHTFPKRGGQETSTQGGRRRPDQSSDRTNCNWGFSPLPHSSACATLPSGASTGELNGAMQQMGGRESANSDTGPSSQGGAIRKPLNATARTAKRPRASTRKPPTGARNPRRRAIGPACQVFWIRGIN